MQRSRNRIAHRFCGPALILAALVCALPVLAAEPDERPRANPEDPLSITLVISKAKSREGHVLCALYDKEDAWLGREYMQGAKSDVDERSTARCEFRGIPSGSYAISVFHDLDSDNQLDRKVFGIPAEPYATSRNAKRAFGPPRWRDAVFSYDGKAPLELKAKF